MSVRAWWQRRGMSQPVAGSYRVTECGLPTDHHARSEQHRLYGVVSAPEVVPAAIELWGFVPHNRWPQPGDVLPVFVDSDDPCRLRVRWERVARRNWMTDARRYTPPARRNAEHLAAEMRKHRR